MAKTQKQKTAGVIFPPPFIYLISVIAGLLINLVWRIRIFSEGNPGIVLGILIMIIAISIFAAALKTLKRFKTPIQPYKPTLKIVRTGPYSFTRNPVYLAFSIAQIGISILLNNLWILIAIIPAIMVVHYGVILREENYLQGKFGKEYLDYKKSVRRWI